MKVISFSNHNEIKYIDKSMKREKDNLYSLFISQIIIFWVNNLISNKNDIITNFNVNLILINKENIIQKINDIINYINIHDKKYIDYEYKLIKKDIKKLIKLINVIHEIN